MLHLTAIKRKKDEDVGIALIYTVLTNSNNLVRKYFSIKGGIKFKL